MKKSVLRSIKPYWLYLIITGKKTAEVGKDCPKAKDWDRVVELYCSKNKKSFNRIPEKDRDWMRKYLGKVACRFVCFRLEWFNVGSLRCDDIENLSCVSYSEMIEYFYKPNELNGDTPKRGWAWHIDALKIYDEPKELGEFKAIKRCKDWRYFDMCRDVCGYAENNQCHNGIITKRVIRPPQSWMYVESLGY